MATVQEVLVSSRNEGKLAEFGALLADLSIAIVSAAERDIPTVEETGDTLAENALLKAAAAYRVTKGICIADDSGLFVDALDGAPGVYSARFAGENVTYEDNNTELLRRLEGVENDGRKAAFVSVMALLVPAEFLRNIHPLPTGSAFGLEPPHGAALFVVEGRIEGRITKEVRGRDGFGYDPLFYVPESGKTFAEMSSSEKNAISHRSRALSGLRNQLELLRYWD
jgi:XTP/dITP diphosphohydrolase